jgi:sugar phosphate isomerase/epimerase
LHRTYFGEAFGQGWASLVKLLATDPDAALQGAHDPADFPVLARQEFGIDAVEYVNTFYRGKVADSAFFNAMRQRADDHGVNSLLIMCDGLGSLAAADAQARAQAIENHKPWMEIARVLGCHAVRVNVYGEGEPDVQAARAAEALALLGEAGAALDLHVLVENHGGLTSDAAWLAGVMRRAAHPRVCSLPDFGNFRLLPNDVPRAADDPYYDRYLGVAELMPFARAVSAKAYDFDDAGEETTIDFKRMLDIVVEAGYSGYVGIEYEGRRLSEFAGIRATQALLQRVRVGLGGDQGR